jgi:hypothetical protein
MNQNLLNNEQKKYNVHSTLSWWYELPLQAARTAASSKQQAASGKRFVAVRAGGVQL